MKHFEAVIFDMDGTLLDTERVSQESFLLACAELGIEPREDLVLACVGAAFPIARRIMQEGYGEAVDIDALMQTWSRHFTQLSRETPAPLKEGVTALLDAVAKLGLPMAVATSSPTEPARIKLAEAGLLPRFRAVVGADQVRHPKPAPEVYLRAAALLGVDPTACLALEDSEFGVRAAHAAGMTVIQVPDMIPPTADLRALGHIVLESLTEVAGYPFDTEPTHG